MLEVELAIALHSIVQCVVRSRGFVVTRPAASKLQLQHGNPRRMQTETYSLDFHDLPSMIVTHEISRRIKPGEPAKRSRQTRCAVQSVLLHFAGGPEIFARVLLQRAQRMPTKSNAESPR